MKRRIRHAGRWTNFRLIAESCGLSPGCIASRWHRGLRGELLTSPKFDPRPTAKMLVNSTQKFRRYTKADHWELMRRRAMGAPW